MELQEEFNKLKTEVKQEVSEVYKLVRDTSTVHQANNVMIEGLKEDLGIFCKKFDRLLEVINGNGHPEEGMVYRQRQMEAIQKACPISKVADDVNEIKTFLQVKAARTPVTTKLAVWVKNNPGRAAILIGSLGIGGGAGFSTKYIGQAIEKIMLIILGGG